MIRNITQFIIRRLVSVFKPLVKLRRLWNIASKSLEAMKNYSYVAQEENRKKYKKPNFYLKAPTRFLGEIHIVLSCLVIISSIITIHLIYHSMHPDDPSEYQYDNYKRGIIFYLIITLVSSITDTGLSFLLIIATSKNSLQLCKWWWTGTLSLLIFYGLFTVAFSIMTESCLLFLTMVPSIIFKPFALWIVDGFMFDLEIDAKRLEESLEQNNKKRTTVFILTESEGGRPRLPKLQLFNHRSRIY